MKKFTKCSTVLFVLLLTVSILAGCGQNSQNGQGGKWQEQYDLGVRYLTEGNYQEAILAFTAAIEIDPQNGAAYAARGQVYLLLDTEEYLKAAEEDFRKALELNDTLAEAWIGLSDVYSRLHMYVQAEDALESGMEKAGGTEDISARMKAVRNEMNKIPGLDENSRFVWHYDADGKLQSCDVHLYDDRENLVQIYEDGNLEEEFTYDEQGRLIRKHSMTFDDISEYTYDAAGNITEVQRYFKGEDCGVVRYEYDGSGNEVWGGDYTENGTLLSIKELEYDGAGRLICWYWRGANGAGPDYKYQYTYLGNTVEESEYEYGSRYAGKTVTEFDDSGNVIKVSRYSVKDSTSEEWLRLTVEYTYDADGGLLRETFYSGDGDLEESVVYSAPPSAYWLEFQDW